MTATLSALAACTIDCAGRTIWAKNIDAPYQTASTMKLLASITARPWVSLTETATLDASDTWAPQLIFEGDTLTYSDHFHAAQLFSSNSAAHCIGRTAGQLILDSEEGTGDPEARFFAEMEAVGDALGWTGHVATSAYGGGGGDRLSAWQLCDLIRHVHATDPWLYGVAGKQAHTLHVSGARIALVNIRHTVDPNGAVKFPEFEAAKSGTGNANQQHVVMGWMFEGQRYFSSIVNSSDRYVDLRAMMDDVIQVKSRRRSVLCL